jgi:hypothetical protein
MKFRPACLCFAVVALLLTVAAWRPSDALAEGTGYLPDPPEPPGLITHVPRYRAFLPAFKDLSPMFPPVGDQGDQNSCVAWSAGYAMRGYYYRLRNQTRSNDASSLLSPAYIYNQLIDKPDCDTPTSLRDALELMKEEGISSLAEFPYNEKLCASKPDPLIKQHAASNVIAGFRSFGQNGAIKADDIKGALLAGNPVVFGMYIDGRAFSGLKRNQIYDMDSADHKMGHAMVVVGFDDRIQAFKIMNSWGTVWADRGFGWVSYRSFSANTHAAFVMDDGKGELAPPPPGPGPGPTPPPNPPPTPPPIPSAGMDLPTMVQLIEAKAATFQCSRLLLHRASDTEATIRGWVGEQADYEGLNDLLHSAPDNLHITSEVSLHPWPQCEALITLSDGMSGSRGLDINVVGHDGYDFTAGDKMVLQVKTPNFPSYLYVTYLPANGDAVSLYKPRGVVPQTVPANSTVNLGGGDDPRVFRVGPPFGPEMVIAVATASPLFTNELPASTTERDYLTALRKTLLYKPDPNQPDRVVDAQAISLTTHDRAH